MLFLSFDLWFNWKCALCTMQYDDCYSSGYILFNRLIILTCIDLFSYNCYEYSAPFPTAELKFNGTTFIAKRGLYAGTLCLSQDWTLSWSVLFWIAELWLRKNKFSLYIAETRGTEIICPLHFALGTNYTILTNAVWQSSMPVLALFFMKGSFWMVEQHVMCSLPFINKSLKVF